METLTKREIQEEITELQAKIHGLEKRLPHAQDNIPITRLADRLHARGCGLNHIDQCGWEYESWDNIGPTREEWLKAAQEKLDKAKKLGITIEQLMELV